MAQPESENSGIINRMTRPPVRANFSRRRLAALLVRRSPSRGSSDVSHDEMRLRLDAVSDSARRTWRVAVLLFVATTLVLFSILNTAVFTWSRIRLDRLKNRTFLQQSTTVLGKIPDPSNTVEWELYKIRYSQYYGQLMAAFAGNVLAVKLPIPGGAAADINEVGFVGSAALAGLMWVFYWCLDHEAHNIRQFADRARGISSTSKWLALLSICATTIPRRADETARWPLGATLPRIITVAPVCVCIYALALDMQTALILNHVFGYSVILMLLIEFVADLAVIIAATRTLRLLMIMTQEQTTINEYLAGGRTLRRSRQAAAAVARG